MTEVVIVLTTWPEQQEIERLSEVWLNKNLVACVNIFPKMRSIYRWNGKIQSGSEHQVLIKTTTDRINALEQSILEAHPYECPEIIYLPVTGGYNEYITWITGNTL